MRSFVACLRTTRWATQVGLIILLCVGAGWAEGSFSYDAPPQCPSRARFLERVSAKLEHEEPHTVERRLNDFLTAVRVSADARRAVVTYGRDAAATERVLTADNCDELVTSVALISAMALEANGSETSPPAGAAPNPSGEVADQSAASSEGATADNQAPRTPVDSASPSNAVEQPEAPTSDADSAAFPARDTPLLGDSEPNAQAPSERTATREQEETNAPRPASGNTSDRQGAQQSVSVAQDGGLQWGLAAGASLDGWSGPAPVWGADLGVRLAPDTSWWSLRMGVKHTRSKATSAGRVAEFRTYAVAGEACLAALQARQELRLELCGRVTAGLMSAFGVASEELALTQNAEIAWLDGAALVRASSPPWAHFRVELQVEAGSAFREHRFEFDVPEATVFHPRTALMGGARAGLLWEW